MEKPHTAETLAGLSYFYCTSNSEAHFLADKLADIAPSIRAAGRGAYIYSDKLTAAELSKLALAALE